MKRSYRYLKSVMTITTMFFLCTLSACNFCGNKSASHNPSTKNLTIHKAHLLSGWYFTDATTLRIDLQKHFSIAQKHFPFTGDPTQVRALVVPHAGHYYSGLCAASAYQAVKKGGFTRVIILAPSHYHAFPGIALPDYDAYQTPLGAIPVDKNSIKLLQTKDLFSIIPRAHDPEHSIEVQLPFLQGSLEKFSIVPMVVGKITNNEYEVVARELAKIIDDKTLIVVSSDFVHHGPTYRYDIFTENILRSIRRVDSQAISAISNRSITEFDAMIARTQATICGRDAIKIVLKLIEQGALGDRDLFCRLASYYTSAQLVSARTNASIEVKKIFQDLPDAQVKNSVSYAGLVLTREPSRGRLTSYEKRALLALARDSIANKLSGREVKTHLLYPVLSDGMKQRSGAFVTLNNRDGKLRGCVGRVVTNEPLFKTVASMAQSSAFHDNRFTPLTRDELDDVVIDITMLTPPRMVAGYKDIQVGKHGIILKNLGADGTVKSAVYLPQVGKMFKGDREKMLSALSRKAGLSGDAWREAGCEFEVFEGIEFSE